MVNADRQYIEYNLLDSYILLIGINYYLVNSSTIFALSSFPLKSFATTLPVASRIKVAGIDCTLYCAAIGSSQNFKFETCVQVNLSFAIASFHLTASLSKETPIIFSPLE